MNKAVYGLVGSREEAERVLGALTQAGFLASDVSVLFPDTRGTHDFAHEKHTKAPEGAIAGVGAGSVVGGTLGLLAGLGAIAIPGIGPFLAAGPILSLLSGAAAGAAVGGIVGALVGIGIPEIEAKQYAGKIKDGNVLLSVHTANADATDRAKNILYGCAVRNVAVAGERSVGHQDEKKRPDVRAP